MKEAVVVFQLRDTFLKDLRKVSMLIELFNNIWLAFQHQGP